MLLENLKNIKSKGAEFYCARTGREGQAQFFIARFAGENEASQARARRKGGSRGEFRRARASGERSEPVSRQDFARNAFGLFSEHTTIPNLRAFPPRRFAARHGLSPSRDNFFSAEGGEQSKIRQIVGVSALPF